MHQSALRIPNGNAANLNAISKIRQAFQRQGCCLALGLDLEYPSFPKGMGEIKALSRRWHMIVPILLTLSFAVFFSTAGILFTLLVRQANQGSIL
jgi:hypothetical protein